MSSGESDQSLSDRDEDDLLFDLTPPTTETQMTSSGDHLYLHQRPKRNVPAPRKYRLSSGEKTPVQSNIRPHALNASEMSTTNATYSSMIDQDNSTPATVAQRIPTSYSIGESTPPVANLGRYRNSSFSTITRPPTPTTSSVGHTFETNVSVSTMMSTPNLPPTLSSISHTIEGNSPLAMMMTTSTLPSSSVFNTFQTNPPAMQSTPTLPSSSVFNTFQANPPAIQSTPTLSSSSVSHAFNPKIVFKCLICLDTPSDDEVAFCPKCSRYLGCYGCHASLVVCPNCRADISTTCEHCGMKVHSLIQPSRIPGLNELEDLV